MATPRLEVTLTAINSQGRKKENVWQAEYGTDQELFELFAVIMSESVKNTLELVREQHGWSGQAKAAKPQ